MRARQTECGPGGRATSARSLARARAKRAAPRKKGEKKKKKNGREGTRSERARPLAPPGTIRAAGGSDAKWREQWLGSGLCLDGVFPGLFFMCVCVCRGGERRCGGRAAPHLARQTVPSPPPHPPPVAMGLTFTKLMARLFSKKEMRILVRARAAARGARRVQCAPRLGCSARAIDRLTRPAPAPGGAAPRRAALSPSRSPRPRPPRRWWASTLRARPPSCTSSSSARSSRPSRPSVRGAPRARAFSRAPALPRKLRKPGTTVK